MQICMRFRKNGATKKGLYLEAFTGLKSVVTDILPHIRWSGVTTSTTA